MSWTIEGPGPLAAASGPDNALRSAAKSTWENSLARCEEQPLPRRRDPNAEAREQAAAVSWIRTVAPDLIVFHPPNGGLRGKAEAARLKWLGTVAGIPDLVVLGRDGKAWLIEMKAPGGSLSAAQRDMCDRLAALRVPYAICRSIDDVRRAFAHWKIPTRESGQ